LSHQEAPLFHPAQLMGETTAVPQDLAAEHAGAQHAVGRRGQGDEDGVVRPGQATLATDLLLEPSFRRIVVLDSVSVLQAQVLELGIDPVELPMLRTVLTPLLGTTTFAGMAIDALTYVALGGLYSASHYIARASDPRAARAEADLVLDTLAAGLVGGLPKT
jgi:hypothetical protein